MDEFSKVYKQEKHCSHEGDADMIIDLVGRIKNIHLRPTKVLLPIYDAVVNSIEAIEDAKIDGKEGKINITVWRDTEQKQLDKNGSQSSFPVSSFIIDDNGIGFDDANFMSFNTSDSQFKQGRGGKGVGRYG